MNAPRKPRTSVCVLLAGGFFAFAAASPLGAQEGDGPPGWRRDMFPLPREGAVVLNIVARVLQAGSEEVLNEARKITMPGRPVRLRLVGEKIVIAAQFTPYLRQDGKGMILVAQGQIWFETSDGGIHYRTAMQTIPVDFGEQVYFFPLGELSSGSEEPEGREDHIEIQLAMNPYTEDESVE